ncbi:hypothetical protein [uncultured Chloroflexus sp.]|uniref:hypothetical protein n=1 Tax=uncultured Chloroflexus sp. TaxID=214040 RepID=UPI0026370695|nr:hypothetical protein [uncultured Chloroflexus sp.]
MTRLNPNAASVDIGAREIRVCVPGKANTGLARSFGVSTPDLQTIAAWLKEHHIETVAMESVSVSWIPLFETLKADGCRCHLISARSRRRARPTQTGGAAGLSLPEGRSSDCPGADRRLRQEHLFVLKQSLAMYDFSTRQIEACDADIERAYGTSASISSASAAQP